MLKKLAKGKAIVHLTVDNYGGVIKDISHRGRVTKTGHFCYLRTSVCNIHVCAGSNYLIEHGTSETSYREVKA